MTAQEVNQIDAELGHAETPTWLILAQSITAVLTFVGTFWLAYEGKAAAPFAGAGVALLLLFRFGDIASLTLEGFGGKADMKRATRNTQKVTREAEKTLEALKQLGMNLSKSVLTLQALQGRLDSRLTFRGRLRARDAIVQNLQDLGLRPEQAQQAAEVFDDYVINDLVARALHFVPEGDGKKQLSREIETVWPLPNLASVRAMFVERGCLTPEAENFLSEAERFQNTRQVDESKLY